MSERRVSNQTLRQEARALRFIQLTYSQREAMEHLVDALAEAQAHSSDAQAGGLSRLLLISGSKGVGKTSILLTFKAMYAKEDQPSWEDLMPKKDESKKDESKKDESRSKEDPKLAEYGTASRSFWQKLEDLKKDQRRIEWLEPLSLDPMPPGTNLVSAVLARIRKVAETDQGGYRDLGGVLDPVSPMERALHMLEGMQSPAVTGLEGNLDRRGGQMDPDAFSITALASERAKLSLSGKLNQVLSRIAAGSTADASNSKAIFVLPVDDLDVRPSRAVEMLQLASQLAVPRLFFLFFGSSDAIDQMLYYRTQGEYYELLGPVAQARPRELERVEAVSNEVSSSLLRKMIPPGQRVEIRDVALEEALTFPFGRFQAWLGKQADKAGMEGKEPLQQTLEHLLLPVHLLQPSSVGKHHCDLLDVLVPKDPLRRMTKNGDLHTDEADVVPRQTTCFYDGAQVLVSPVRQLSDIQLHMVKAHQEVQQWARQETNRRRKGQEQGKTPEEKEDEEKEDKEWLSKLREAASKGDEEFSKALKEAHAKSLEPKDPTVLNQAAIEVVDRLVQTFISSVDEDPHLTVPLQQRLKVSIRRANATEANQGALGWELTPPEVKQKVDLGDRMTFLLPLERLVAGDTGTASDEADPLTCSIETAALRRVDLGAWPCPEALVKELPEVERRLRIFGPRTRPAFKVLHDLIHITGAGSVTLPVDSRELSLVASTRWDDFRGPPLVVPWMTGRWQTFWHQDRAFTWWNEGVRLTRKISSDRADLKEESFAVMLALFRVIGVVDALLATGDGKNMEEKGADKKVVVIDPRRFRTPSKADDKWRHTETAHDDNAKTFEECLLLLVTEAAERRKAGQDDARADQIDEMLIDLVCFASPEVAIPWFDSGVAPSEDPDAPARTTGRIIVKAIAGLEATDHKDSWAIRVERILRPQIRHRRLERMGVNVCTLLGLTLLRPDIIKAGQAGRTTLTALAAKLYDHRCAQQGFRPTKGEICAAIRRYELAGLPGHIDLDEFKQVKALLK